MTELSGSDPVTISREDAEELLKLANTRELTSSLRLAIAAAPVFGEPHQYVDLDAGMARYRLHQAERNMLFYRQQLNKIYNLVSGMVEHD